jgi:L-iditol 2-dehydrogenase
VRAVVLGPDRLPEVADVPEPEGPGEPVRVLACGLCGSDLEKIGVAQPGTVLGHEVVGESANGRRVALVHHRSCGECERCRAGHESMCEHWATPTIVPGGLAERVHARDWAELPSGMPTAIGTFAEPLACVLRGAERVPCGRVLVIGQGFVGRLFAEVLRRRGDEVFAIDARPERSGPAAVLCGPGGADAATRALAPGGTILVFASAGELPLDAVYRHELLVTGIRGATPADLTDAVRLLPELDLPEPVVLPLERFDEGLELYRSGTALKVVFTP